MNTKHDEDSYWQPRVMRHVRDTGEEEFAIHEVYFTAQGDITGYTDDALSMREPTVEKLREKIVQLLQESPDGEVIGDLSYTYHEDDIQLWLSHIDDPVIDYANGQILEN